MYDIIFIGDKNEAWEKLRDRFPTAKHASTFEKARKKAFTKMFWAVWQDVHILSEFDFSYQVDEWSTDYVHVFKNGNMYDGIVLCNKRANVSQEELETRLFENKKEVDIQATVPKDYDTFYVDTYRDYCAAFEQSTTKMFWAIPSNVDVLPEFDFSYHSLKWDEHLTHVFKNGDCFDGVVLHTLQRQVSQNEFDYAVYANKKEVDIQASEPKTYDVFYVDSYDEYLAAREKCTTDMMWIVPSNANILPDFEFNYQVPKWDYKYTHVFKNGDCFDGVILCSVSKLISKNELEHAVYLDKKEVDIQVSNPKTHDVFYISDYDDYLAAREQCTTDMMWIVPPNVNVLLDFSFDYQVPKWDKKCPYVFKNGEYFDGVVLCSPGKVISKNEFEYATYTDKKEIDVRASVPSPHEVHYVNSYQDYCDAYNNSKTVMFWTVPSTVDVLSDFRFDYQVPKWDRRHTYVFENGNNYDGVVLHTTSRMASYNEFEYSFYLNRKEVYIQASVPKLHDAFYINDYNDYLAAREQCTTSMMWIVPSNVTINNEFKFDYQVLTEDKSYTHIFKNGEYFDGVVLCSTDKLISRNEFDYSTYTNKKEIDIQATVPNAYEVHTISTYDDYLAAREECTTDMMWVVPSNVNLLSDFEFSYQVPKWDYKYTHVFKNGEYFDGVILCSTDKIISKNELNYSSYTVKKEIDVQASDPALFDVVFISYNEANADENYNRLLAIEPRAKRVHGVKGIHQAHIAAATQCNTTMFWVVDGDAEIVNDFNFTQQVPKWEQDCVHVWRSQNPINDLTYGYGGVKLLPTELTKQVDVESADMTTSISNKFKAVPEVSNVSVFNTDAFSTWRSAFRECVKLSSNVIRGQIDEETRERLDVWCTIGRDRPFGNYAIRGALSGTEYGSSCVDSAELGKINDYDWLKEKFDAECR